MWTVYRFLFIGLGTVSIYMIMRWHTASLYSLGDPCDKLFPWAGLYDSNGNPCIDTIDVIVLTNDLSGDLPDNFDVFTSLKKLNLFNEKGLTNSQKTFFPHSLCRTNLTTLQLEGLKLTGTLPTCIGRLKELTSLTLRRNYLSGDLPTEIGQLSELITLQLGTNGFSRPIPIELAVLSRLSILDCAACLTPDIFGKEDKSFPEWVTGLPSLRELNFAGNTFSSTLPTNWTDLKLQYLNLSGNEFRGTLPSSLGSLVNLLVLDLKNNFLKGMNENRLRLSSRSCFSFSFSFSVVVAISFSSFILWMYPSLSKLLENDRSTLFHHASYSPTNRNSEQDYFLFFFLSILFVSYLVVKNILFPLHKGRYQLSSGRWHPWLTWIWARTISRVIHIHYVSDVISQ